MQEIIYNEPSRTTTTTHGETTATTSTLFDKYELGKFLGCGGFAKVYHARDTRTGESVAVKSISKQKIEECQLMAHVKREVTIMRKLRHPHIIQLREVLATRSKIHFIMDFAKGGELFAKIAKGRFSEDLCRKYFHQLISAVEYCHSRGVFHRDLKPENLLLDENWSLKITDFGLSAVKEQIQPDGKLYTLCGTPAYVAPEILVKNGYDGAKVDIWSCGIILFVLNSGYLPFNDTNLMNLYRKIYKGEFRCPKWMSSELRRFLGRILDPNPETRITINGIIDDPWFKKGYREVRSEWEWCSENEGLVDKKGRENENDQRFMNAFDLISFSPGFSLKGLFGVEEGRCRETYVAAEDVATVVEKIEELARRIDAPRVDVERVKGGMGVKVEGQNGQFGVVIVVHQLTEQLVVIEVRKREKDAGTSHEFWRDVMGPMIRHLFCKPG